MCSLRDISMVLHEKGKNNSCSIDSGSLDILLFISGVKEKANISSGHILPHILNLYKIQFLFLGLSQSLKLMQILKSYRETKEAQNYIFSKSF